MQGSIRTFTGLALLIAAGSIDPSLSDLEFVLWSIGLAIPGILIALSGTRAMNQGVASAPQPNFWTK
jgi:hypothetical protein